MLERLDHQLTPISKHLGKLLRDYFVDNVFVTTSGFFSQPILELVLKTFGPDRVMFSVDYPFETNDAGRAFLDGLEIAPRNKEKIAHLNAERILGLG